MLTVLWVRVWGKIGWIEDKISNKILTLIGTAYFEIISMSKIFKASTDLHIHYCGKAWDSNSIMIYVLSNTAPTIVRDWFPTPTPPTTEQGSPASGER